ncbi:hypothetical protein GCM10027282_13490 [Frigoribacterium salinisoli]
MLSSASAPNVIVPSVSSDTTAPLLPISLWSMTRRYAACTPSVRSVAPERGDCRTSVPAGTVEERPIRGRSVERRRPRRDLGHPTCVGDT